MLSYLLAVLAACSNAASSILQRTANRRVPRTETLKPRLIWDLAHQPVWFGGVLAVIASFLLQASALGTGTLIGVEPVLVLELPLTLIVASRVFGSRLPRREWGAIALMTAALAGLLYFLGPSAGHPAGVRWYAWLAGIGMNLLLIVLLTAWARRGPAGHRDLSAGQNRGGNGRAVAGANGTGGNGRNGAGGRRAAPRVSAALQAGLFGTAAGAAFGLTAALMKGMTEAFAGGFGHLLASWQLYAMVGCGVLGMFLTQAALNAGRLLAAQPGLTLADPVVSILWGVLVFREHVRMGAYLALAGCSAIALVVAVAILARSPVLSDDCATVMTE